MLIEFRLSNFRSFRDEQVLSFVAGNGDELPHNRMEVGGHDLVRSAAIYGPNASGKSNLVSAMLCMFRMIAASPESDVLKEGVLSPFLLDSRSRAQPTSLEATFLVEGTRYQYGFSATQERVHEEWLLAYPKGRAQKWFHREYRPKKNDYTWHWSTHFRGQKSRLVELTRKEALFLTVGTRFNHPQLTPIHDWLTTHVRVLPSGVSLPPVTARALDTMRKKGREGRVYKQAVLILLREADLGITDVEVKAREFPKPPDVIRQVLSELSEEERGRILDSAQREFETSNMYDVRLGHKNLDSGESEFLSFEEESAGTRRFFNFIGPWLEAVGHGYIVVVDEIETSLHPLLTRELVKFFHAGVIKERNFQAQLVFSTHDTTLLDPELLRRDQVWFTEKDEAGATRLYSLYDYKEHKARKGEAMQKGYLAGRYGAIPILEAFARTESNGK